MATKRIHLRLVTALAACVSGLLTVSGCRQQAYTEVYIENMAMENRALEDRIYEYDAEYRALESELDAKERENEALRRKLLAASQKESSGGLLRKPRNDSSQERNYPSVESVPSDPLQAEDAPGVPSILLQDPPPPQSPAKKEKPKENQSDTNQAPAKDRAGLAPPVVTPPVAVEPPQVQLPNNAMQPSILRENLPKADTKLIPPANFNPFPERQAAPESVNPVPESTPNFGPMPSLNRGIEMEQPPKTFNQPETLQPTLPTPDTRDRDSASSHQIVIPGLLEFKPVSQKPSSPTNPLDSRIVEIGFHPSLCRAHNSNSDPAPEGIYLVLQPRNAQGQYIPEPADTTIVMLDPSRHEDRGRIGTWSFSRTDVASQMTPLGNAQGIHLSLDWQKAPPKSDRVILLIRYSLPDGRTLVNEREIVLQKGNATKSAWMPRASGGRSIESDPKGRMGLEPPDAVVPASANLPVLQR